MPPRSERPPSSSLGPPTTALPADLLADLQTALSSGQPPMPPAVASALLADLQRAVATPGSVKPAALLHAFEQLEDVLEAVLLLPAPAPPA
ncbi:MAG: hypothetical protein ACMG6S_29390 [Byssovorax sp.]